MSMVVEKTAPPLKVLVVDDEPSLADSIAEALAKTGLRCLAVESAETGRQALAEFAPDIVVTDLMLAGAPAGLALLNAAKESAADVEVLLITAFGTVDTCRAALQQGAFDYLTKPLDLGELRAVVRRAAERIQLTRQVANLRNQLDEKFGFEGVVGQSPAMVRVIKTVRQVAASNIPVLLQGESGTGKELLAHAVHANSPRRMKPFVALNCAGLSESILEDELFGHVRGAFTGATGERKGRFEHADGGTLFLDEIGDMPAPFQAKLLRVLENGEVVRLGSNDPVRVDVRLISATNRDLAKLVEDRQFRQDLFFRIKGVTVTIPPLRQRREDIPALVDHFLATAARNGAPPRRMTPAALRALAQHDWPGNVRQLKTAVDSMVVLAEGEVLDVGDIPDDVRARDGDERATGSLVGMSIDQAEKVLIKNTLGLVGGNREQAAKMLGIGERTLYRKIKEYGLE